MSTIDWAIIGAYFFGVAAVLVLTRRARTMADYAVGSRKIPGSIVFATLSATFIGPGYTMGLANKAADKGYVWLLIFLAFSVQTILVGMFVAPRLRRFANVYTLGSIMGNRYGKLVQLLSGVLSVGVCAGIVGAITKASGDIISGFTGLPFIWAVILSAVVVLIYSTIGGIKSVIITDVIQFVFLSVCIPLILLLMVFKNGLSASIASIAPASKSLTGGFSPVELAGLLLAFFLGETLIPPYTNRALMARDEGQARKGFLLSGGFSVSWFFVCASIGVLAFGILPAGTENYYLGAMQAYLPAGLLSLAVAAMISIIMSSQDSCLNAASVSFSCDVMGVFSSKFSDGKEALLASKTVNILVGAFAVFIALNVPNVVAALMYCYALWAPTVVLPLVIAVFKKDAHPYAAFAAIVAGGVTSGICQWGFEKDPGIAALLGVAANQAAFWLFHFMFRGKQGGKLFVPLGPADDNGGNR